MRCGSAAGPSRAAPSLRYRVSHMPRAGWAGGMLSASKLYQSVSASGPSATAKPMEMKVSSSSSRVWVTRCRWPRSGIPAGRRGRRQHLGQIEALVDSSAGPRSLGLELPGRRRGRPASRRPRVVDGLADLPALLGLRGAPSWVCSRARARPLAEHARVSAARSSSRSPRPRSAARPRPRWPRVIGAAIICGPASAARSVGCAGPAVCRCPSVLGRSISGRVNRNVVPCPAIDSATNRPPWASTRPRLIHSPSPDPCGPAGRRGGRTW